MSLPQDGRILEQSIILNSAQGSGYTCSLRGVPEAEVQSIHIAAQTRAEAAQSWCEYVRDWYARNHSEEAPEVKPENVKRPQARVPEPKEVVDEPPSLREAASARLDFLNHTILAMVDEIEELIDKLDCLKSKHRGYVQEVFALEAILDEEEFNDAHKMGDATAPRVPSVDSEELQETGGD